MLALKIDTEETQGALVIADHFQADQVYWRSEKFDPKASSTELTPVRAGLSATRLHSTPATDKESGRCCQPFGRTTVIWGAGKEYPVKGEDFAFMLFRKRNCCVGY